MVLTSVDTSLGTQWHTALVHWVWWQLGSAPVPEAALAGREVKLDDHNRVIYSTEMLQKKRLYSLDVDKVLIADVGVAMLKVKEAARPSVRPWVLRVQAICEALLSNSQCHTLVYRTCCWGEWGNSASCSAGPAFTCCICLLDWHSACDGAAHGHIEALSGGDNALLGPSESLSLQSVLGHAIPPQLLQSVEVCSWCKWCIQA